MERIESHIDEDKTEVQSLQELAGDGLVGGFCLGQPVLCIWCFGLK